MTFFASSVWIRILLATCVYGTHSLELPNNVVSDLYQKIGELSRKVEILERKSNEPTYAFMVSASEEQMVPENGRFRFDHVVTNVGNAYDGTSDFICPVDGVYVFSVHLLSSHGTVLHGNLVVGDQALTPLWVDGSGGSHHGQAAVMYVAACDGGTRVHVQGHAPGVPANGGNHCSFSGFLLTRTF